MFKYLRRFIEISTIFITIVTLRWFLKQKDVVAFLISAHKQLRVR